MDEADIKDFWSDHPCGDEMIGGLALQHRGDYERFFDEYDRFKYALEPHIPGCLDLLHVAGREVLEIGLGQGAESEQLIRRGAHWSGLDLTAESVQRVRTRLALRKLPGEIREGSALEIPWPDSSFDLVFSHGVLHHIPDVHRAQSEIRRVLRPHGKLVVMLYARRSLNYQFAIRFVRRLALLSAYPITLAGWRPAGLLGAHVKNARSFGLRDYLRMDVFVSRNTDGPGNPFSRVYSLADVRRDFSHFEIEHSHQHFMHAPPIPVRFLPGESKLGWHLWVHLRPIGARK